MPLAYAISESQSGAGTAFDTVTEAIGAFDDTADSVVLAAGGSSKLLTLDFAQITGAVDNLLVTVRTRVLDTNFAASNRVVAQLYDGATLLGTTASRTLDSSGGWANVIFALSDFLIAAVPLDLASNPRTNPVFHLKLTFTNADLTGATIYVDGASLATPPTILSARLIGTLIVITYSEDVAAQNYDDNYHWTGVSGIAIDEHLDGHTDTISNDGGITGALVTLDVDAGAFVSADNAIPNEAQHIIVETGGENGAAESSAGLATDVSGVRASGPSSL